VQQESSPDDLVVEEPYPNRLN